MMSALLKCITVPCALLKRLFYYIRKEKVLSPQLALCQMERPLLYKASTAKLIQGEGERDREEGVTQPK